MLPLCWCSSFDAGRRLPHWLAHPCVFFVYGLHYPQWFPYLRFHRVTLTVRFSWWFLYFGAHLLVVAFGCPMWAFFAGVWPLVPSWFLMLVLQRPCFPIDSPLIPPFECFALGSGACFLFSQLACPLWCFSRGLLISFLLGSLISVILSWLGPLDTPLVPMLALLTWSLPLVTSLLRPTRCFLIDSGRRFPPMLVPIVWVCSLIPHLCVGRIVIDNMCTRKYYCCCAYSLSALLCM